MMTKTQRLNESIAMNLAEIQVIRMRAVGRHMDRLEVAAVAANEAMLVELYAARSAEVQS